MPVAGGDRRGGGAASRAPSIPRCGVSSPFRGHLSTKSNAFCTGHSSRLSDQYQIQDHMLVHYNKILTAKAAVDCSVPKSLTKSVKYNDQQRRERLKTVVTRMERDSLPSRASSSRPDSRESLDSALQQKDLYGGYGNALRRSPYSDPGASPTSFLYSPRHFHSSEYAADFRPRHPDLSGAPSRMGCGLSGSSTWGAATQRFQDNREKTYSGDLIEKHAHHFTSKQRAFTPRTLKTPAKSALAQSRFYTPPRRKRRETVSEVQTDLSSFRGRHEAANRNLPLDGEQVPWACIRREDAEEHSTSRGEEESADCLQVEDPENSLLSEEEVDDDPHRLSASRMSSYNELKSPSPTTQRIHSEEEELAYLGFVADVTNEILSLGLFSDRILNRVFERHLRENRHRLDEGKMCHLLETLRADLDSKDEKQLDLFEDHNFSASRHFRDPFVRPRAVKNDGFRSQDFLVEGYKSNLRYLHGKDDEPQLREHVQTGLDEEDKPGPSGSLICLDKTDLDHNNFLSGQEDVLATPRSPEAVISLPEDELDTSLQKDDFLSLQDNHKETYSESQDNIHLSEETPPVDNVLPEDHNEIQRSFSQMGLNDLPELDQDLKTSLQPRDLEDLEQSFSEIIQVSKAEDSSVHETENVPSDREDIFDLDDF
ncbi:PREDICTED: spermatogenesis-associated protein 7 [Nanorana parkeri]|uniref:spermatogenesis-associated protein 7 n=1 Tax=Nanorana parkeri TaxID=125878 RepID=UPI0008545549|nr:PREDICTED: spermatogenesis-associated protein 7 [Nanorana parkeri]